MPMYNALKSTLWLGFFIGMAVGSLMGIIVLIASYPYIEYVKILFTTFMFSILGMFSSYAILFGMEHFKARKNGMIYLWAEYETAEIMAIMKEYQLQVKM